MTTKISKKNEGNFHHLINTNLANLADLIKQQSNRIYTEDPDDKDNTDDPDDKDDPNDKYDSNDKDDSDDPDDKDDTEDSDDKNDTDDPDYKDQCKNRENRLTKHNSCNIMH